MGLSCTKVIRHGQENLGSRDSGNYLYDQCSVYRGIPAEPIAAWQGKTTQASQQEGCHDFSNAVQYTQLQLSLHRDHPWNAYWRTLAYMLVAADNETAERLVAEAVMPYSILVRAQNALMDWRRSSFILAELEWLEGNLKASKERSNSRREVLQWSHCAS